MHAKLFVVAFFPFFYIFIDKDSTTHNFHVINVFLKPRSLFQKQEGYKWQTKERTNNTVILRLNNK